MKLAFFCKLLVIFYLFICTVLSSADGSLKPKDNKGDEMSKEEKAMRDTLSNLSEVLPSGSKEVPNVLLKDIADYNKRIAWKTKRLDPSEVKSKKFEGNIDYMYVIHSGSSLKLTRNQRKIYYEKESKDLIIKETAACSSNLTRKMREKRLHFVIGEYESIKVYLGNRYLVIHGDFQDDDNDHYKNIDIYDLNSQEFWNAKLKANSRLKTILSGNESYGIHIKSSSLYPTYKIGMWRDEKKEEYVVIPIIKDDKGFERYIDRKLEENREEPNDNLVIGGDENVVILDLKSIKDIDTEYGVALFTANGQIMKIRGKNERREWKDLYYKIIRKEKMDT